MEGEQEDLLPMFLKIVPLLLLLLLLHRMV